MYKLIRFLVERLSESAEGVKIDEVVKAVNGGRKLNGDKFEGTLKEEGIDTDNQKVELEFEDLRLNNEEPRYSEVEVVSNGVSGFSTGDFSIAPGKDSGEEEGDGDEVAVQWDDQPSLQEQSSEV